MAAHTRDIGRFSNATLIGRGGFGAVYRATDVEHGREVAIKVLQGTLGETERRRFDRERQTMGRLGAHPNIVPVHESGYTEQGEGYIVMSLATKGSVADRLEREGPLPWPDAVAIIVAIARAAQAAHEQGVLHRDIKPDNILIDAYDNPRLTDFGIAAVASNATATTSTTATIAHAAPEVLHGLPPTPAIDIYALGSTLYNLIVGRPPFQEPGDHGVPAMITRALTQPPPDLRKHGVPDAVADIATRALAKEASGRPSTAAQLADELDAARASATTGGGAGGGPAAAAGAGQTVIASVPVAPPPIGSPNPSSGHHRPTPAMPAGPGSAPFDPDRTLINPSYDGSGSGGSSGGGGAGGDRGAGGSNRLLYVLVGAGLTVVVAVLAVVALSFGGGDEPNGEASASDDETSTDGDPDDSASTSASTPTTTTPTTSSTTVSTTASTGSTTETTATTVATSTTSTTTTTTGPTVDPACPLPVIDTQTPRFRVRICGDSQGRLAYVGRNRTTGDGIRLPACHAGGSIFTATNEGFEYVVDAGGGFLLVTDPDGDEVVFEPLQEPVVVDDTIALDPC